MGRSWLDNEKTERHYRIDDRNDCIVQNEYQRVKCLHCNKVQYCRLTRFWLYDRTAPLPQPILHNNYNSNLDELKKLLVQYVNKQAITERQLDGRWILEKDGKMWGVEYEPRNQQ